MRHQKVHITPIVMLLEPLESLQSTLMNQGIANRWTAMAMALPASLIAAPKRKRRCCAYDHQ